MRFRCVLPSTTRSVSRRRCRDARRFENSVLRRLRRRGGRAESGVLPLPGLKHRDFGQGRRLGQGLLVCHNIVSDTFSSSLYDSSRSSFQPERRPRV